MMQKKPMTKRQYKILSMIWMLAAAATAVAFVRRIAEFNLILLLLMVVSLLLGTGFWKSYKTAPEVGDTNKQSEEKNQE